MLFFLLCLYMSFYYIRPFEWLDALKGTPIFLVLGLICILSLILAWSSGNIKLFRYKTDSMMAGFATAILLSHLSHGYIDGAVTSILEFIPTLVAYFLVAHGIDSRRKAHIFILLLVGLTTFLAYQGHLQVSTGTSVGGMEPATQQEVNTEGNLETIPRIRWFGTFNDPNDLGLALVLVVPFLVDMFFRRSRILPLLSLPIVCYAVNLANSRGAMLSLAFSLFAYLVLRSRSVKGVVFGLLMISLVFVLGPSRMSAVSASESSAHGRIEAWHEGFQMLKANPLFGVGKGRFTEFHILTAHNSYVLVISELGIFGSLFFTGLFFYCLQWCWHNLLKGEREIDTESRNQLCAIFGSLLGIMVAMFFLSRSYNPLPFMLLGLIVARIRTLPESTEGMTSVDIAEDFQLTKVFMAVCCQIIFINIMVKLAL